MAKKSFDKLFEEYDIARAKAKQAKAQQEDLNEEIKGLLEEKKLDEVDSVDFTCIYKFEKDKETEVFDEVKFAEKEPKKFKQYIDLMNEMKLITKKYTKKVTTKGARKLIITRKNEGEE
jgi:hypothetical protein